jgi:hypothetical protein
MNNFVNGFEITVPPYLNFNEIINFLKYVSILYIVLVLTDNKYD